MTRNEKFETPNIEPRSARGRDKRDRLLRAAEDCFGRLGYAGASVAEISRVAGVSHGGFYVWFPSKESVFTAVVRDMSRQIREVGRKAREGTTTRAEAEIAGSRAFFDWLVSHRYLHRILHQIDEVDQSLAEEFYRSVSEPYAAGISAGQENPADPELMAYTLMGMNHFVSMRWILWTGDSFPEELFDDYARLVERLFAADIV
ncbi:TetR/AcrR family transcriptional regulator [Ornithinimicrobium faecis]|uniref:TetR/AcrR family transcriptional regulator n=1 Tax=Ornithinimicrobium faecis TaxID=2934158 RepID=UPI0021199D39|nr:TetR/AcrR family transcriptional regulator [Ornithinimicrobium sp. HY1745]